MSSNLLNKFLDKCLLEEDTDDPMAKCQTKPERNLLAAMLSRAICDAFGDAHCEGHFKRQARSWIFARLQPTRPYTFAWTAAELDINAAELQRNLRNADDKRVSQIISVLRS